MEEIQVTGNVVVGKVDEQEVIRVYADGVQCSTCLPVNLERAALYAMVQRKAIMEYRRLKDLGKIQ